MAYKEIALEFDGYWRKPAISGLPSESGIYCVYTCTHNKEEKTVSIKRLIYIGESEDVNDRISKHEKWDEWESYLSNGEVICVSCATVSDSNRIRAEAAMIYKHDPPENTEYVSYFPFDKTKITTSGKNKLLSSSFVIERDD